MPFYTENVDDWTKNVVRSEEEWQRRRRLITDDIEDAERRERPLNLIAGWGPFLTLAFSLVSAFGFATQQWVPRTQPGTGERLDGPWWGVTFGCAGFCAAVIVGAAVWWGIYELYNTKKNARWYGRRLRDHDSAYVARTLAADNPGTGVDAP